MIFVNGLLTDVYGISRGPGALPNFPFFSFHMGQWVPRHFVHDDKMDISNYSGAF